MIPPSFAYFFGLTLDGDGLITQLELTISFMAVSFKPFLCRCYLPDDPLKSYITDKTKENMSCH